MQVEWHGWQDDAKVSVHVRDERGMVVAAIEGGQTDNKLDRAHVISPSGEVFTADLGHIDVSATRNIERIKLFSKRRHKLTYFLGGYVRQGGTERSSIWHSDADMGVFPARISLKCDGSRIRVWRGKRPDADLSDGHREQSRLIACVATVPSSDSKRDGVYQGPKTFRLQVATELVALSSDDQLAVFLAIATDLFWSNGFECLQFAGLRQGGAGAGYFHV